MSTWRPLPCLLLGLAGCASGTAAPARATERDATASSPPRADGDAAFDKALADSAVAFDAWLAQFFVVAKTFDGADCDGFVAQVKTLEPRLAAYLQLLVPYQHEPARLDTFKQALEPRLQAMNSADNKAVSENFVRGVKACSDQPELRGALERGMFKKK